MAVPWDMLVHPELLSNEQLIAVIQERHLRIPNVEIMPRDDLLELFHNFCVPYGQRKCRDRGRGKIVNKGRQTSPEPTFNISTNNQPIFSNQSSTLHSHNFERLRPPPDTLAGHMKRIKITTLALPIVDNNLKRKITLNPNESNTDSPPQKKERKPITWP